MKIFMISMLVLVLAAFVVRLGEPVKPRVICPGTNPAAGWPVGL